MNLVWNIFRDQKQRNNKKQFSQKGIIESNEITNKNGKGSSKQTKN